MTGTLAIDVALLPPAEVMKEAHEANRQLWEQTGKGFRFDETHLPHVTLLQQFIRASDLAAIVDALTSVAESQHPITMDVTHVEPGVVQEGGFQLPYWQIVVSDPLVDLHRASVSALRSFVAPSDRGAFLLEPNETVRELTWQWINQFLTAHAGDAYSAHLTLGNGRAEPIEPFSFTSTRLALCHLGNFNTCRKILHEWTLQ